MGVYEHIKQKFVMPNAYNDWSKYREQVTKLIIKDVNKDIVGYESVKTGVVTTTMKPVYREDMSIAILGAGACNDFDLLELSQHFDRITLIDVDMESMQKAIEWMPEILKERINLVKGSLTGITNEDQKTFCDDILFRVSEYGNSMTPEKFSVFLIHELKRLEKKMYTHEDQLVEAGLLPVGGYDVVVCIGVCSQLMSMLSYIINVITANLTGQLFQGKAPDNRAVFTYIKGMNSKIVPIINSAILKCSNEKAVFGNEYDEHHPVEGAYQCIIDLKTRLGLHMTEEHLTWNFNPGKNVEYDMLIQMV